MSNMPISRKENNNHIPTNFIPDNQRDELPIKRLQHIHYILKERNSSPTFEWKWHDTIKTLVDTYEEIEGGFDGS